MTNYVLKSTNYDKNHPKGWFFVILINNIWLHGGESGVFQEEKTNI